MRDDPAGPVAKLDPRIFGVGGQRAQDTNEGGGTDGFLKEGFLGAEIAENGDFIHLGRIRYAPGGRSAESVLGKDLHGRIENSCSSIHGRGN